MSFVLGLTGTFGSGKSTVAAMIKEMTNAPVIDADLLAREALAPGSPLLERVAERFGRDLLQGNGRLNRSALARRAFATPGQARDLNDLVHPWVRDRELAMLSQYSNEPLVVLDVPLLFEAGMETMCTKVAAVTASEAARFRRLRARGFGEQEVIRRLGFQLPQSRKAAKADWVLDNSGKPEQTRAQVKNMLEQIHEVKTIRS